MWAKLPGFCMEVSWLSITYDKWLINDKLSQLCRCLLPENDGSAEEDFGPLYPTREPELPTFSILMDILPKFCHRYLAPEGKKDVRIWLWKGRKGRRARTRIREYLKMFEEDGESTAIEYLIGL